MQSQANLIVTKMSTLIASCYYFVYGLIKSQVYRHYVLRGGRGSLKSSFISLMVVVGIRRQEGCYALVLRKTANSIELSVFAQVQWAIDMLGWTKYFRAKRGPYLFEYMPTGQVIYFKGLDDPIKIKSIKIPMHCYFGYLWFEELNEFDGPNEIRSVIQSTIRGTDMVCMTFYSYNPPKEMDHWVFEYTEQMDARKDAYVHTSNFTQVPKEWLGTAFLEEAMALKEVNPKAFEHEYMGHQVDFSGMVFNMLNPKKHMIHQLDEGEYIAQCVYAIDGGIENDATAGVPLFITTRGRAIVGKVFYYDPGMRGCYPLSPSQQVGLLWQHLRQQTGTYKIPKDKTIFVFDSASSDLRREFAFATGAKCIVIEKKSIKQDIWRVQNMLTEDCLYFLDVFNYECPLTKQPIKINPLFRELYGYRWSEKKLGKKNTGEPAPGQSDHAIDALKYATFYFSNPQRLHSVMKGG